MAPEQGTYHISKPLHEFLVILENLNFHIIVKKYIIIPKMA